MRTLPGEGGRDDRLDRWIGAGLFLIIFTYYVFQIPAFAVPGRWAEMLASFSGLDPFRPLVRPLWTALMQGLASLPVPNLALVVNVLSALAGAGSCTLLYASLLGLPFSRMFVGENRFSEARSAHRLAGVLAALYAAVSQPMVTASTRGDFAGFDLFLMLLAVYPSLQYYRRPRNGLIYLSGLMAGFAVAEYPGMLLVLPGLGLWWALLIWRFQTRAWRPAALAALLAMSVALIILLGSAQYFSGSEEAGWRGGVTVGQAFVELAKNQAIEAAFSVPKVGWLLLLCVTLGPLIFVVLRPLEETTDLFTQLGIYFFRLVLLVLGITILFELPGAPSRLMNARVLLVAPYLVAGLWFGHLIGYYYGLSLSRPTRGLSRVIVVFGFALTVAGGFLHAQENRTGLLAPVVSFADRVVAALPEEAYVVTDGSFDASIRLVGHRTGKVLHLINVRRDNRVHAAYYASLLDNPQLRSAAHMGVRVLLNEWMNDPSTLTGRVAVLTSPHVLPALGFDVVPAGLFYRISRVENRRPPELLLQQNQDAWASLPPLPLDSRNTSRAGLMHGQTLQHWVSRLANDVGVALEECQSPELARQAYEQSLAFWPDNVSPSMNLLAQAQASGDMEQQDYWTGRVKDQLTKNPEGLQPLFVRQVSGTIRNPMMSYETGSLLARSGRLQEAVALARKASVQTDEGAVSAQLELARLFLRGQRPDESEKILRRLLDAEPENLNVHLGLLQIALHQKKFAEAEQLLNRLEELGLPEDQVIYERAGLAFTAGRLDEAKEKLQASSDQSSAPTDVWYILACISEEQKNEAGLAKALAKLKADRFYLPGQYLLGEHALRKGNPEEARRYFEHLLSIDPSSIPALTRLAQMDYDRRDAASLRLRAGALLALDPGSAFGNFAAANVHLTAGRLDLAEVALRRSLDRQEFEYARNDLAWVLSELGKPDEALEQCRRALELNPHNGNYWATLAGIYEQRAEPIPAREAIVKALELSKRMDPVVLIQAAKFYLAQGLVPDARDCANALSALRDRLSPSRKAEVDGLIRRLPDA